MLDIQTHVVYTRAAIITSARGIRLVSSTTLPGEHPAAWTPYTLKQALVLLMKVTRPKLSDPYFLDQCYQPIENCFMHQCNLDQVTFYDRRSL